MNFRTRNSWHMMKQRCLNPKHGKYKYYGGRGIQVCKRWMESEKFLNDMGERPENTTLDRIDNNGNYEPDNCRWATSSQQANNTKRNRFIKYGVEKLTIAQWEKKLGHNHNVIGNRIRRGWDIEKALFHVNR